jgi:hypothetical protein
MTMLFQNTKEKKWELTEESKGPQCGSKLESSFQQKPPV